MPGTAAIADQPDHAELVEALTEGTVELAAKIDDLRGDGAAISAYTADRPDELDFIAAAANGTMPASETEEPVYIESFETNYVIGSVMHYDDESFALLTIEKPAVEEGGSDGGSDVVSLGTALPGGSAMGRAAGLGSGGHAPMASVTGCQALPSSGGWIRRKNCKVTYNNPLIGWRFYANYSVRSGGGRIDSLRTDASYYYNRVPGRNYIGQDVSIYRRLAAGSAAPADGRGWLKTAQAGITTTRWLSIRVYGSAWSAYWDKTG